MSFQTLTDEEAKFVNDLNIVCAKLWTATLKIEGHSGDPKLNSCILYQRLWSNYRGFILLRNAKLQLEADIVLRSALEAAICIAANYKLGQDFSALIRGDLVATLKNHIKRLRDDGELEMVRDAEAELRRQAAQAPTNPKAFIWKELANVGGQPMLYTFHKNLSMMSSHVTGFSLMRGIVGVDGDGVSEQTQLLAIGQKMHLMMMASAITMGAKIHANVIGETELETHVDALTQRLDTISTRWLREE